MNEFEAIANTCANVTQAARWAREEANAIIEQLERRARGFDRGAFRDDDTRHIETIQQQMAWHSQMAFTLSERFTSQYV